MNTRHPMFEEDRENKAKRTGFEGKKLQKAEFLAVDQARKATR